MYNRESASQLITRRSDNHHPDNLNFMGNYLFLVESMSSTLSILDAWLQDFGSSLKAV